MSEQNPFLNCYAQESEHGTGWSVISAYWNIPCQNERTANRVAEIIQHAYRAGYKDKQDEIKKVLGINNESY